MLNDKFSSFKEIINLSVGNNTIERYFIALLLFLATILILKTIKTVVQKKLLREEGRYQRERTALTRVLDEVRWPLYLLAGIHVGVSLLVFGERTGSVLNWVTIVLVAYYLMKMLQSLVDYGVERFSQVREEKGEGTSASAIKLIGRLAKMVLWIIGFIIVLQNLGYNVSTLAAGLGIGGLAIAFALQNILGDVFASFSIYFDRPFEIGDFIIVGKDMGTVQHIGIKSTRLRTLQGQELVISNKELTESRVHNYRRMNRRRISFDFGVEYGTSDEKMAKIPLMVKEIIDSQELAETDRVHFKELGPYSLNFEVVYYVNDPDYNLYMDIQQSINLALKKKFAEEKILFAFPRQDISLLK